MWKILLPVLLLATACGQEPEEPKAPRDMFRSVDGDDVQMENAHRVATIFREYLNVDASRVDLLFVITSEQQLSECKGFAACTHSLANGYHIATYWPSDRGTPSQYARLLAHELCHVYYMEDGENPDGDPNHTHTECFAEPDYPTKFGPGEGIATKVALQFQQEVLQ